MSEIINKKYFTDESLSALGENIKNYVADAVDNKAESEHAHDDKYYTKNEMDTKLQHKSNATHNHDAKYDAIGAADTALASAKDYADEKVANLLDNSTEAVDSVMELAAAMKDNADAIEALETIAAGKVDKVEGKGLSTNDYTSEEKVKLASIEDGANKTVVDEILSETSTNAIQNKAVTTAINELSTLVGDTPVSDQITDAISDISFVDINLEDAESGTPTGINADTLGGYPPEYFLGNGGGTSEHNHDDIYYTETEIDAKIAEIDGQIAEIDGKFSELNASVANIVSGTTTVDNATKAVQDANGNVIADTYATKAYIEELIGGIENGSY